MARRPEQFAKVARTMKVSKDGAGAETDTICPKRSANMARVRSRNTTPERAVRSMLHRAGYRFRLHSRGLPGTPDIVLPALRLAVFVNGCFWHQHSGCRRASLPSSRRDFWLAKLNRNIARDREVLAQLKEKGWSALVVWECSTRRVEDLIEALSVEFDRMRLESAGAASAAAGIRRRSIRRRGGAGAPENSASRSVPA